MAKLCPLAAQGYMRNYDMAECKEEKCAWWCKDTQNCAICEIAERL